MGHYNGTVYPAEYITPKGMEYRSVLATNSHSDCSGGESNVPMIKEETAS